MPLVTVRGKASRDSKSAWTERKITVSANIYPGTRGGNVRLDSDSELISFEIPTPRSSLLPLLRPPLALPLPRHLFFPLILDRCSPPSAFPPISLARSRFLCLPILLALSALSSFPLSSLATAFESRPGLRRLCTENRANAFGSAPFSIGRIRVSSLEMGERKKAGTNATAGGGGKKKESVDSLAGGTRRANRRK